jgi:uncharacterized protein
MGVFLAKEFDIDPRAIAVVYGRMNMNKLLRIKAPQKLPAVFQ